MATVGTELKIGYNPTPDVVHSSAGAALGATSFLPLRFERFLTAIEVILDFLAAITAIYVADWLMPSAMHPANRNSSKVSIIAFATATLCVIMLDREGAYHTGNGLLRVRETERVLRVCAHNYVLAAALILVTGRPLTLSSLTLLTILICLALLSESHLVYLLVRMLHLRGIALRKVIIVGAGEAGRRVFSALERSPKLGMRAVAIFDENPRLDGTVVYQSAYKRERALAVTSDRLTLADVQRLGADLIVVAMQSAGRDEFAELLSIARAAGITFAFVPHHYLPSDLWTEHVNIDGVLLASVGLPPRRLLYEFSKRLFDILGAGIGLIFSLPLWMLTVLLIRRDSPGPAIFQQRRVGKNGRMFRLYKFRTMYLETCGYQRSPQSPNDPRITKIGRLLRRASLDELPQLLNVLLGNMSLVGPRPEMPFLVESHEQLHRNRLHVKPGITGLWQISADRSFHIHENVEYDLYYIRHRNFFMDLAILLHTLLFAVRGV